MKILSFILAGGSGEELGVLTSHRAKTAVPFGGRYRIIDFCLSNCVNSGITTIYVMAQFNPKSLIEHIGMGKPWDLDRKIGGIYIMQPSYNGEFAHWYRGTGDAIWQNIEIINDSDAELVLILSGDQAYSMDYGDMIERHMESTLPITVACKEVSPDESQRFGMIKCNEKGIVEDMKEKPMSSEYNQASLGIYLFDRGFIQDNIGPDTKDIVFDLLIPNIRKKNVATYRFDSYWEDIGSLPAYYNASMRILDDRSFMMNKDLPLFTRESGMAPTSILSGSDVKRSIIADGCKIGGKVVNSILFPGVRVNEGSVVEDSIIFSSTVIGKKARVMRSIVDKSVLIEEEAHIGSGEYDKSRKHAIHGYEDNGLITVVGKGCSISKGAKIPAGSMIEPEAFVKETLGDG